MSFSLNIEMTLLEEAMVKVMVMVIHTLWIKRYDFFVNLRQISIILAKDREAS